MRSHRSYAKHQPWTGFHACIVNSAPTRNASRPRIAAICLVAVLGLFGAVAPAHAGTITVNSTAQRGSGTSGVCTIGAAIIAANTNAIVDGCTGATASPNTIMVPSGTYTLAVADNTGSFGNPFGLPGIQSDITITGAASARTIIERSLADGTPDFGIFDNRQNTGHLTLNNLTIRNGHYANDGAAVFNIGGPTSGGPAALTVNNCLFDNNVSTASGVLGGGGAVGGGGTFSNSSFTNNIAAGDGGAIQGISAVTNSFFSGNIAGLGSGRGSGGAVSCRQGGCSVTISDSTFISNGGQDDGGAVVSAGVILRSVFTSNSTFNGAGGAILLSGGTITDSLFLANSAGASGGAVDVGNNVVTISGSSFENNAAFTTGGAFVGGGGATLINDTFAGNVSISDGGAIQSTNGLILNNVTVTRNDAHNGVGGGIAGGGDDITNSIIAGNTNGSGANPDCSGSLTSQGHNLIGAGDSCTITSAKGDFIGTVAIPVDPVVGILADNTGKMVGSTGHTAVIQTAALLIGSPALDLGDPGAPGSGGTACAATDERGVSRPIGAGCDTGAYEAQIGGVIPTYDLSVTNTAPATITLGSNLTYTIKVSNSQSDTATGPSLTGAINPSNFVSISASGWACKTPLVGTTGGFICNRASLASNSSSTISLVVTPTATGSLSNTVTVASTGNDTNGSNNSATTTVTVQGTPADLSLTGLVAPDPVNAGSNQTYTFTAKNNGPGGATNVDFSDSVPASTNFVSVNASQGSCTQAAGNISCNLGSLANGNTATVTVVVNAQAGPSRPIATIATVTASEPDPTNADNSASLLSSVSAVADMAITMTTSANTVQVGNNVTYTATVKNNGPSPASSVTLTDTLPANVTLFAAHIPAGVSCNLPAVKIVCSLGSPLSSGGSFTIAFILIPQAGAVPSITNTMSVSATEPDPNNTNNTASVTTAVTPAPQQNDFSLTFSQSSATVEPGGTARIMLTVTPQGGYLGAIFVSCTGAPSATDCGTVPSPIFINSSNPAQATLLLQTTAPSGHAAFLAPAAGAPNLPRSSSVIAMMGLAGLMVPLCLVLRFPRSRILLACCAALVLCLLPGCSGDVRQGPSPAGTPKGTYAITVTASDTQISHSSTINLKVGP